MSSDLREPTDTRAPVLDPPPQAVRRPVGIGLRGWLRWAWRQLTSMRTALLLLFLLAVVSAPGSVLPQRPVDPAAVGAYLREHPALGPWLDRLRLFDVFSSPWFAAVYLLLFISLAGCVLPRTGQHLRAVRGRPPAPPRQLSRLPVARRFEADADVDATLQAAHRALRAERLRVDTYPHALSAEGGHLRETGNLVFHAALVLLLVSVAYGRLFGFSGDVVVAEGRGFSNVVALYDTFRAGARFDDADLVPFTVRLESLRVRYQEQGRQAGAPREFTAHVRWRPAPDEPFRAATISPNHPLVVDGTKVFLLGNGYAPQVTVRDGGGRVVFSGPVPFLPDARAPGMQSTGVVKVADIEPDQLGIRATLLPSAVDTPLLGPVSVFPDLRNPRLYVTGVYRGDLGVDDGTPQNVYRLDTRSMRLLERDGKPLTAALAPGATLRLPDGAGSVTFDGVSRFAALQVRLDPGRRPALAAVTLALGGLLASLFVRRRRVFVRVEPAAQPGRAVVEVGALARTSDHQLPTYVDRVVSRIQQQAKSGRREGSR